MCKTKMLLRIVTITLVLLIYCASHAYAFDLDLTVEDDIRKNYNSSKLINDTGINEESLPDLPEELKNSVIEPDLNKSDKTIPNNIPKQILPAGNTKIHKGTVFKVVNTSKISDWQKKGSTVKFKTNETIKGRKYSIPAGTQFAGEVIESHQPQISCNGGLVVIRIRYMIYKGQTVPLNAYITKANGKLIFLNNIKGERTYLKTMWKKGNWGRSLFSRMLTLTINLGGDTSTVLLSPFPFLYGTICLGANTLFSPVTAFFQKGGHVSINAGSNFKIRLMEDIYID